MLLYIDVLPVLMSKHHVHTWCSWWPEEGGHLADHLKMG